MNFNTASLTVVTSPHAIAYSYAGNANFNAAMPGSGSVTVSMVTPAFSNLSSPAISYGTASTAISGKISSGGRVPSGSVSVTINGVTQPANIQANGNFSVNFNTGSLGVAGSPYPIAYAYAGDANFNAATPGSGSLTVNKATPTFASLSAPTIVHGSSPTVISGVLLAGSAAPSGSVSITLKGTTQTAAIQADGRFSATFITSALTVAGSPYGIVFRYTGDANFRAAPNGRSTLTVTP